MIGREYNKPTTRNFNWLKEHLSESFKITDTVMRSKAVETIEYEVQELQNIFDIFV